MLFSTITTIQNPTKCVENLVERLADVSAKLVVAGDKKGPHEFSSAATNWPVEFLSLDDQNSAGFSITENLPTGHYARKNVAYLHAMQSGASCIYETDDDNSPNSNWTVRKESINGIRTVQNVASQWVNVYRYFTNENIWPRGLPLDEIMKPLPGLANSNDSVRAPIQQGLVNGSPDVDAIWRLVMDRPFDFEYKQSVYLPPGNWCPFNTQSTWWWPTAYPLLYVPSFCSFRMCDIWKSFVAQRCLWAMGLGVVFHAPEVVQDRNEHNLQTDFDHEVPGYTQNRRIAEILDDTELDSAQSAVSTNLIRCYEALVANEIFPAKEIGLVNAWINDCKVAAEKVRG